RHLIAARAGAKRRQVIRNRNVVEVTARSDVVEGIVRSEGRLESEDIQIPISVAEGRAPVTSTGDGVNVEHIGVRLGKEARYFRRYDTGASGRHRCAKIEILRVAVDVGVERDVRHRALGAGGQ